MHERQQKPRASSIAVGRQRRRREVRIPTLFQLVIECRDETQQREVYERLAAAGIACKVMTL